MFWRGGLYRSTSTISKLNKVMKVWELRYSSESYGQALAGRYEEYEDAARARREHYDCAMREGNKRLAASFEII